MSIWWGALLGNAVSSGIKTYGDVLNLAQATRAYQDTEAERQAAQGAGGAPQDVTGANGQSSDQLLKGIQGNNATQDPEAAMQGLVGVKTAQNPQQAQAALSNAQQMQNASSNANPATISVPAPQQPTPTAASLGIGASTPTAPTGAPAGQITPPTPTGSIAQAIHGQETGGKANSATSVDGAVGGWQITPATFHAFAKPGENINNPTDNEAVGERIIAKYAKDYGNNPGKIATAYFSGPGNVNNDPNATTPYVHDYKDGNGYKTSSYVQSVMHRLGFAQKVNGFAGSQEGGEQTSTSITPDTKLTMLTAKQLPQGVGPDQNLSFSQGQNGGVQMQKTVSPVDRAMAAANEAWRRGDTKNAGALTQAAMTLQSQMAQQRVNQILNNSNMSQDEKVAALGALSGSKVFKAENGSYIVPGLGPTDANGNPAPMTYQQVGAFANWMTSPEGMHYAMDYNMQMKQLQVQQQNANTESRKEAVTEALAPEQQRALSEERQANAEFKRSMVGNVQAQADLRNTQAQNEQEWNNIQTQVKQAGADLQAGKITPVAYKQIVQNLNDQANVLKNRMTGGGSENAKAQQPQAVTPDVPVRNSDGSVTAFSSVIGKDVPYQVAQKALANTQAIQTNPTQYKGFRIDPDSGGVFMPPDMAKKAGINPNTVFTDAQTAWTAFRMGMGRGGGIGGPAPGQLPETPAANRMPDSPQTM